MSWDLAKVIYLKDGWENSTCSYSIVIELQCPVQVVLRDLAVPRRRFCVHLRAREGEGNSSGLWCRSVERGPRMVTFEEVETCDVVLCELFSSATT